MGIHVYTPHVAEVSVLFTDATGDTECESTFYVEDNTDAIFDDAPAFATKVWNAWVASVVPKLGGNVFSHGVIFEDQRALPYAGAVFPKTSTPGARVYAGYAMPCQNAFAIKRSTSALGRSGRGRLYWPIWQSNVLTTLNTLDPSVANDAVAALAAFQATVEGGTLPCLMGIVSKQHNGTARAFGQFTQITGWSYTDLVIDSQRRRLPGRGR